MKKARISLGLQMVENAGPLNTLGVTELIFLLDGAQLPGASAPHRSHKSPEFPKFDRFGFAAGNHSAGGFVRRIIQEIGIKEHGEKVITFLLPSLGDIH